MGHPMPSAAGIRHEHGIAADASSSVALDDNVRNLAAMWLYRLSWEKCGTWMRLALSLAQSLQ